MYTIIFTGVYSLTSSVLRAFLFLMFIYLFFLALLDLHSYTVFSLTVVSRGYSPVAVNGLLIAVASLVTEHRL